MIGESVAVVVVLALVVVLAARSGRGVLAKLTIPFFCVPVIYLVGMGAYYSMRIPLPLLNLRIISAIVGLSAGIAAAFVTANLLSAYLWRTKTVYIGAAVVYMAAFALAYILRFL